MERAYAIGIGKPAWASLALASERAGIVRWRSGGASVATRKDGAEMSPYAILGSSVGTAEAAALCVRLTAWHDAMVAHERRLRTGRTADACDDECPHDEARTLWTEALTTLGPRASELTFLRSRANGVSASPQEVVTATPVVSAAADGAPHTNRKRFVERPGLAVKAPQSTIATASQPSSRPS